MSIAMQFHGDNDAPDPYKVSAQDLTWPSGQPLFVVRLSPNTVDSRSEVVTLFFDGIEKIAAFADEIGTKVREALAAGSSKEG